MLKLRIINNVIHESFIFLVAFITILFSCSKKTDALQDKANIEEEYKRNFSESKKITDGKVSLTYSLKAYELAKKLDDALKITNSLNEVSHDYEKLGMLDQALRYSLESIKICESQDDKEGIAIVYNRIGTMYFKQGDTILSLKYIEDALKIHREINSISQIGDDLNNIGEIYRLLDKNKEAKACFIEAANIFSKLNDSIGYAYTIGNIGLVNSSLGLLDSSKYYIDKAKQILENAGDYYPIAVYLTEDAKILFKNKQYNESLDEVYHSLELAEKHNLKEQLVSNYQLLSDIYLEQKNYKEAYSSHLKYDALSDSITNVDLVRKMESQRTNYEVSKRESEIKGLEHINQLRTRLNIMLGIGIAIVAIFIAFFYRLNRKLKSANGILANQKIELEQKGIVIEEALHEKESLLKEIHHRVKNNLQIISSLLSLQSRQLKDKEAKAAIEESHQRLKAISLIHQKLYQSDNIAFIKIPDYIAQLMEAIHSAFVRENAKIDYSLNIGDFDFDIDTTIPLGLIINELAINAFKYAFPDGRQGHISISLLSGKDNTYTMIFKDNGIGLPAGFDPNNTTSLGLRLVTILSKQLEGSFSFGNNEGAEFIISFINKNYRKN
jgi:two-component sensor histidine kinase